MSEETLNSLLEAHVTHIESAVSKFTDKLTASIEASTTEVNADLMRRLTFSKGGVLVGSTANFNLLRNVDDLLNAQLGAHGYTEALGEFIDSFAGQFSFFQNTLTFLDKQLVFPLPKPVFDGADKAELEALKLSQKDMLEDVVRQHAEAVKQQVMLSVGAVTSKQLTGLISDTFSKAAGEASGVADTALSTFYRSINDRGYQMIEDSMPGFDIRYSYEGPLDKINRPFCRIRETQSRKGKTWTRAEIALLKNGQLPNVWITCGGYRCRHQWIIAINSFRDQQARLGQPSKATTYPSRERTQREIAARRTVSDSNLQGKARARAQHSVLVLESLRTEALNRIAARRKVA